jgi:hypothetical protein
VYCLLNDPHVDVKKQAYLGIEVDDALSIAEQLEI